MQPRIREHNAEHCPAVQCSTAQPATQQQSGQWDVTQGKAARCDLGLGKAKQHNPAPDQAVQCSMGLSSTALCNTVQCNSRSGNTVQYQTWLHDATPH